MAEKILVVEDELTLQETLAYNLKHQGYEVITTGNGLDAIKKTAEIKPDLIILDVMLPGADGFEVCRQIRKEMNMPILMLTARTDEIDRVVGLEVGADDYLTKPFSMRELIARIKAMLRRMHMITEMNETKDSAKQVLIFGNLVVNEIRHEATLDGFILALSPKEFDLLLFLVKNKGKMVTRELVLEKVWGWEFIGNSRSVDVHVRWLREKIEADPKKPNRIITVRGGGYIFEG
jgi:DNA-binding response OmpR family regulator